VLQALKNRAGGLYLSRIAKSPNYMSVKRIWQGWTTPQNIPAYQDLLHQELFPGIEAIGLLKKWCMTTTHFATIKKPKYHI
jgi:hypothetical protein